MPRINLIRKCGECGRRLPQPQRYFHLGKHHLTRREFTIYVQLAKGLTQRQAAKVLGIDTSTLWNNLIRTADRFCVVDWRYVLREFKRVRELGNAERNAEQ